MTRNTTKSRTFAQRLIPVTLALGVLGGAVGGLSGTASAATVWPVNYWSSACPTNMHEGEGDGCVAYLQEQLNKTGTFSPPLAVDGGFGPNTEQQVLSFQNFIDTTDFTCTMPYPSLSVDGVVGPETKTDLDKFASGTCPAA